MDTKQLKTEVEKGLRAFKAFEHGQSLLAKLEGLEQTITETEARVQAVKAEESQLMVKRGAMIAGIDEARREADNILKAANESAAGITAAGIKRVDDERALLAEEKAAAEDDLKAILDKAATASKNLKAVDAAAMEARAELNALKAEKDKILASFGGK